MIKESCRIIAFVIVHEKVTCELKGILKLYSKVFKRAGSKLDASLAQFLACSYESGGCLLGDIRIYIVSGILCIFTKFNVLEISVSFSIFLLVHPSSFLQMYCRVKTAP